MESRSNSYSLLYNSFQSDALSGKQDTLIAGTNITIADDGKTISASSGDAGSISYNSSTSYSSGTVGAALNGKQDTLVSGTNIKTINNTSLLGSGNISISGGCNLYVGTSTLWSSDNTISLICDFVPKIIVIGGMIENGDNCFAGFLGYAANSSVTPWPTSFSMVIYTDLLSTSFRTCRLYRLYSNSDNAYFTRSYEAINIRFYDSNRKQILMENSNLRNGCSAYGPLRYFALG